MPTCVYSVIAIVKNVGDCGSKRLILLLHFLNNMALKFSY